MPTPKEDKTKKSAESKKPVDNEFLGWLNDPVQEFDTPDLPAQETEKEYDPFEIIDNEPESRKLKNEKETSGMASRYVKLFDKGFSGLAAAYSSGDVEEFKIDKNDQEDLAEPLAELIAKNDILDLPPSWALVVTALIIYAPLMMKAVSQRKDNKIIEEKTVKKSTDTSDSETVIELKDGAKEA